MFGISKPETKNCRAWISLYLNFIAVFFIFSPALPQSDPFIKPIKITTYAGENYSPAVSPDGNKIVFVSNRSGNADIYVKPINQPGASTIRLTHYSGVDRFPSWSPDGKKIVFVSHREDPDGDLYILDLTQPEQMRKPKRLTEIDRADSTPVWSPDGQTIYFASRNKTEELENIWKLDLGTGKREPVTQKGGSMPALSPDGRYLAFVSSDENPNGNISISRLADGKTVRWTQGKEASGFPSWGHSGKTLYFSRCADDTNLDGMLTFLDNPSLWSGPFRENIFLENSKSEPIPFRQLTSGDAYDIFPTASGRNILYVSSAEPPGSSENQTLDILSLPDTGISPVYPDIKTAIRETDSGGDVSPYRKLMLLRNLLNDFPFAEDTSTAAAIHYRMGRIFNELNNRPQALEKFVLVSTVYPGASEYSGLSKIEIAVIDSINEAESNPSKKEEAYSSGIQKLEDISSKYQKEPLVSGTALLRVADFHLLKKDHEKALAAYDHVANHYDKLPDIAAEAVFNKSRVYKDMDSREKLVEVFLNVLRTFPGVPQWSRKASDSIIRLNTASGPVAKQTERLYQLSDKYSGLAILPAAALNKAGELYYRDHENLKAKQAYHRVIERFSHIKEEAIGAKFSLAKIYFEEEEFDKSFDIYKELQMDPAYYFRSRLEFIAKLLSKGERELKTGEAKLAVKTFKNIIQYDFGTTEAHRGLIQSYVALSQAETASDFYKKELARLSKDPPPPLGFSVATVHYSLGLSLTYIKPPQLDEAHQHIEKAVSLNGNDPYYFQTLGWLHEQKYQATGDNHYLEQAADAYQTAISLNQAQGLTKNLPDLWLNIGNAQYLIQNYGGARLYYQKRLNSDAPFGPGKAGQTLQALYFKRFGEVSFKLGKPDEAVEYFLKALSILKGFREEENYDRISALHSKIGLVYQDAGEHEKAAKHFSNSLELYRKAGDSQNVAKSLRNIANNLYFSSQKKEETVKNTEDLRDALNHYFETIQLMEKTDLAPAVKKKQKNALIQLEIEQGLDEESSRAATGFSKKDEEKLLFNYIGKIYGDFREYSKAVEYFKKKLDLTPSGLPLEGNIPVLLERAIIENQIGHYLYLSGNHQEALSYFQKSLNGAMKLSNNFGIAVNAVNVGKLYSEMILTGKEVEGLPLLQTMGQLNQADKILQKSPEYIHNGVLIHLKNLMGILYFTLSQEWVKEDQAPATGNEIQLVKASLTELDTRYSHLLSAQNAFREGLELIKNLPADAAGFNRVAAKAALENNYQLTGGKIERTETEFLTPDLRWQLTFQAASTSSSDAEEAEVLSRAVSELESIPYAYKKYNRIEKEKAKELYQRLAWLLMKTDNEKGAFHIAERGRQWELRAGHEGIALDFENPGKNEAYRDIAKKSSEIRKRYAQLRGKKEPDEIKNIISGIQKSKAEYKETLSQLQKKNPEFSSLFEIRPPEELTNRAQTILGKDECLVRAVRYGNSILKWVLTKDSLEGKLLPLASFESGSIFSNLKSHYRRIYLIPDPGTEDVSFPGIEVAHIASLSHLVRSYEKRNLAISNLLLVGKEKEEAESFRNGFRHISALRKNHLNRKTFLSGARENGLLELNTKTVLNVANPAHTYLELTETGNLADRLETRQIYTLENNGYLIALSNLSIGPDSLFLHRLILADALTYAGYPYLLINTGPFRPDYNAKLTNRFFQNIRSHPPSRALILARKEIDGKFSDTDSGKYYQLFGYGGMNQKERLGYAKKNLKKFITTGVASTKEKKWSEAILNFENAVALLDALDQDQYRDVLYKNLVTAAVKMEDYEKAISYQKLLLGNSLKKKPKQIADAYHYLGYLYYKSEDYPSGIANIKKAIAIYEKNNMKNKMAEAYRRLGIAEEKILDYQKALMSHGISRKISAASGKSLSEGRQLNWIGSIHLLRLNEYGKSIAYFEEAFSILEKEKAWKDTLESLLGIGRAHQKQSRFDLALEYFQKALDLAKNKKFPLKIAECEMEFANTYWYRGEYQKAFMTISKALEKAEKNNDMRTQTFIHSTMGLIFWTLNDYQRALDSLEKSLGLARKIKSDPDIATVYNNTGLVYRDDKKYEEALVYFDKALKIDTKINTRWGLGYDHRNIGMTYLRMKKIDQASEHIEMAYRISKEINNRTNLVKTMLERGNIALEKKNFNDAVAIFQETFALSDATNIREVQWRAMMGEAKAYAKLDQKQKAIEKYKQAVEIVEKMRSAIKVEELRNGFVENKGDLYQELILLLLEQGKIEESFNYSERARARSFIDLLGNQKLSLKNSVEQEDFEKLQRLKQQVEEAEDRLKASREPQQKKTIESELRKKRDEYGDALIAVKSKHPQLSNFITVDPLKLEEVYTYLDPQTTLLEFMVTEKETVVWVLKKGSIRAIQTPVAKTKLTLLIKDFRKRVQSLAPLKELGKELYAILIKPLERELEGTQSLGLVPHSILHYLSFSALRDENSYLIEKYPIYYSPSASLFKFTMEGKKVKARSEQTRVLAIGNPDLGDFNYDLPLAELEANALRWDFPKIDVLTGEKAKESWVANHIKEYDIIHIASHGEFDSVNPLFSSLKLTRDLESDGNLEVNEVFGLEINATLVTLSACQTGLGKVTGGDELIGLNRAFFYAGTKSLISSLWRVSDVSTAILIKHFYRNFAHMSKSEALRKAQLQVKRYYPHPSYWAGFNLTGNYN